MTPAAEVLMLRFCHTSHYSDHALSSTLSIYSTLIAIVLRDNNAAFLCNCWFLFILWWDCWAPLKSLKYSGDRSGLWVSCIKCHWFPQQRIFPLFFLFFWKAWFLGLSAVNTPPPFHILDPKHPKLSITARNNVHHIFLGLLMTVYENLSVQSLGRCR